MMKAASIREANGAKCETSIKYDNAAPLRSKERCLFPQDRLQSPCIISLTMRVLIDKLCCQRPSDDTGHVIGEITDELQIVLRHS